MLLDVLPVNTYAYAAYVPTGSASVTEDTANNAETVLPADNSQPEEEKEAPTIYLLDPTAQTADTEEAADDTVNVPD
jgi:hypothetical protein